MSLLANKDFQEFVGLLSSNGVKYLIVGGYAVVFHGHPRFTADLDIWVATDLANAALLEKVVRDFGFERAGLNAADFSRPGYAIQFGRPPYRIDILTSIDGVDFTDAYKNRVVIKEGTTELAFLGIEDLLRNKHASGRAHDLDDAKRLEAALLRGKIPRARRKASVSRARRKPPKSKH